MKPIEILQVLFFIERGYLNANQYVFRSKRPVLIDTAYITDFDIRMVSPGHGRPFTTVDDAIAKCQKKIRNYFKNSELISLDLLKKITIYTLLMHKGFNHLNFFNNTMVAKKLQPLSRRFRCSDYFHW